MGWPSGNSPRAAHLCAVDRRIDSQTAIRPGGRFGNQKLAVLPLGVVAIGLLMPPSRTSWPIVEMNCPAV
jgi:hypothetical protein